MGVTTVMTGNGPRAFFSSGLQAEQPPFEEIPIIDFGQTVHWGPSAGRGPWGLWLWRASFFLAAAGWIVTALGAAAITGIIRRE